MRILWRIVCTTGAARRRSRPGARRRFSRCSGPAVARPAVPGLRATACCLGYVLATTSWVILTFGAQFFSLSSPHIVVPPQTRRWAAGSLMMTVTALILDMTLAFMLLCFFTFHLRMVLKNETTIEGPSPQFDVGARRNCAQVFGANRWLWLLPVWGDGPDGDGVHWPMHPDPELCAGEVEEGHGDVSNAKLLAEADYDWDSD